MTYFAAAGDLVVESEVPLPGLCPARGPASFCVSIGSVGLRSREIEWIQRWTVEDDRCWLACGRAANGYVLQFTGAADVLVDVDSRQIVAEPHLGREISAVASLVAAQVIPRLLSLDGTPVLHASAVAVEETVVVFAGPSGAGKSTLAAALCGAGGALVADDFVALLERDGLVVCPPTSTSVNLAPDSLDMLRIPSAPQPRRACSALARPVRVIYLLDQRNAPQPSFERVSQREAFIRLFRLAYRMDPAHVRAEFARLCAVVAAVPVCVLRLPRAPERLQASVDAVLHAAREAPPAC